MLWLSRTYFVPYLIVIVLSVLIANVEDAQGAPSIDITSPTNAAPSSWIGGPTSTNSCLSPGLSVSITYNLDSPPGGGGDKVDVVIEVAGTAQQMYTPTVFTQTGSLNFSFSQSLCSVGDGTRGINVTLTSADGSGPDYQGSAVRIDQTPPTLSYSMASPLPNGNGWNNTNVSASFSCQDALSGPQSSTIMKTISTEGTGVSTTAAATECRDQAGNAAASGASSGTYNIDKTRPTWGSTSASPSANGNGWNNTNVTVSANCMDTLSGPVQATASTVLSAEGQHSGIGFNATECVDLADNQASGPSSTVNVNIDKTPPSLSFTSQSPSANGNGWNNTSVQVNFGCTDALSGTNGGTQSVQVNGEGANQQVNATPASCIDLAGNSASSGASHTVNIDLTPPSLSFNSASPSPNGNGWNNTAVGVNFDCTDALSGTDGGIQMQVSTEGANQQVNASASSCTDHADNAATSGASHSVNIDMTPPSLGFMSQNPTSNANGWNNTEVEVIFSCTDSLSGTDGGSQGVKATQEGANQTINAKLTNCVDRADNSATTGASHQVNIDFTPPQISGGRQDPLPNEHGWNNTDVNVIFNCTDTLSGPAIASLQYSLQGEGASQGMDALASDCLDLADNMALSGSTYSGVNIDKTPPAITIEINGTFVLGTQTGSARALSYGPFNDYAYRSTVFGPYEDDVIIEVSGSDGLSGLDSCSEDIVFDEDGLHTANASCEDLADNTTTIEFDVRIGADSGSGIDPSGDGTERDLCPDLPGPAETRGCPYVPIVINEVAWAGTSASAEDQWIELYNNTDRDVDLDGWTLRFAHETGTESIIFLSGTIEAHGYYLMEHGSDEVIRNLSADLVYSGLLSARGEALRLADDEGLILDRVNNDGGVWPAGLQSNNSVLTMERIDPRGTGLDENWQSFGGTPSTAVDRANNPIMGTPREENS